MCFVLFLMFLLGEPESICNSRQVPYFLQQLCGACQADPDLLGPLGPSGLSFLMAGTAPSPPQPLVLARHPPSLRADLTFLPWHPASSE